MSDQPMQTVCLVSAVIFAYVSSIVGCRTVPTNKQSHSAMTEQPTPSVTHADVERVVRRDFPAGERAEVTKLLERYGTESWHRETDRVRLATLKLASGNIERLRREIEGAQVDYRDVLAAAEYPEYSKRVRGLSKLAADEIREIVATDWKQYQDWLTRS